MSTPVYGLFNSAGAGLTYDHPDHNEIVNAVELIGTAGAEPWGTGAYQSTDFNASIVVGAIALDISAGTAVVGASGARRYVSVTGTTRLTTTHGLTGSATNYVYLQRDGTFVANTTGTAPANSILVATAVMSGVQATSVDSLPAGRVNIRNPVVLSGLAADRPSAGVAGRFYWESDTASGTLMYDNGAAWVQAAPGVGGGGVSSHTFADTTGLGASHTTSGLTAGMTLVATGASAARFEVPGDQLIRAGTLVSRPAAGLSGRLYLATDDNSGTLYRDSGTGWDQCGAAVNVSAAHVLATTAGLGANHTVSGLTVGQVLRANSSSSAAFATLSHSDLSGVSANQHHNQVHVLVTNTALGPDHTISGGSAGWVPRCTSATTMRLEQLQVSDLGTSGGTAGHVLMQTGSSTFTFQAPGTQLVRAGILASRPAASAVPAGTLYLAADDGGGTTYRSDGTSWVQLGASVTSGSVATHALATTSGLGANHTVSGLSAGHILVATGATSAQFEPVGTQLVRAGVLASRPAATAVLDGTLYLATDENGGTTYRSNGTSWVQVGAAVGGAAAGGGWTDDGAVVRLTTSSDFVTVGSANSITRFAVEEDVQSGVTISGHYDNTNAAVMTFLRSRGTTASKTALQSGDLIGGWICRGYANAAYFGTGAFFVSVDGAPSATDVPSMLEFQTRDVGGSSGTSGYGTTRLRIRADGTIEALFNMSVADGKNVVLGTTTGTQLGTSATQRLGFWGATPIVRPTVTGSRGGNAALQNLISAFASMGLVVDSTTA